MAARRGWRTFGCVEVATPPRDPHPDNGSPEGQRVRVGEEYSATAFVESEQPVRVSDYFEGVNVRRGDKGRCRENLRGAQ